MQIIIISPDGKKHRQWHLTFPKVIAMLSLVLLMATFAFSKLSISSSPVIEQVAASITDLATSSDDDVDVQASQLEKAQAFYAKRLGKLQAEAIRLTALTEKLADLAGVNISEFSLSEAAPQGGISENGYDINEHEFDTHISDLERYFKQQSKQIVSLQNYFITENSIELAIPSGRPIENGWISSYYGNRIDPFNGKQVFHRGLDFAGKSGSNVMTVADGIVSWKGKRNGYGEMIDIDHGNGYVTRYAHNKKVIVNKGERVTKGQTIALMGSTGRSTGPHVHFEVLRDGKSVNPYNFVKK
jgi:murein DD-endopeptidase MepM/ murein hydrolase activator NlpD